MTLVSDHVPIITLSELHLYASHLGEYSSTHLRSKLQFTLLASFVTNQTFLTLMKIIERSNIYSSQFNIMKYGTADVNVLF